MKFDSCRGRVGSALVRKLGDGGIGLGALHGVNSQTRKATKRPKIASTPGARFLVVRYFSRKQVERLVVATCFGSLDL
jgi:hypothetical protein